MNEKQTRRQIKCLRINNGLEFCSEDFDVLSKSKGIVRHHMVVGTPQKNGVTKWMNITIMVKVRCKLSNVKLSTSFWAEMASTTCFLINRSPTIAIEKKTPIEVWFGTPIVYYNLKIFGCPAYACVNNGKLEPRSVKCVFLAIRMVLKGTICGPLRPVKSLLAEMLFFL